ncbi:MAG: amphi-Trp domain-containing protein [Methylophilaceae bacterium]
MEQQQFKHESLQDKKSIQNMLKSISKAIAKGELKFSDQDGEIVMEPKGLLNLKISARKQDGEQRLDVRVSWKTQEKVIKKAPLSID